MSENFEREFQPYQESDNKDETTLEKQESESVEKELSPEALEKIMAKVEDIDTPGIAYTTINTNFQPEKKPFAGEQDDTQSLESVLYAGLAPVGQDGNDMSSPKTYFNITGRMRDREKHAEIKQLGKEKSTTEINLSYYSRALGSVTVLFDVNHMNEVVRFPGFDYRGPVPEESYRADDVGGGIIGDDVLISYSQSEIRKMGGTKTPANHPEIAKYMGQKKFQPHTEAGFVTSERISSQYFKGIVINPARIMTEEEASELERKDLIAYRRSEGKKVITDKEEIQAVATKIVKRMINVLRDKPERFIPIYDINGNLLWPKKMSYEEVKKFVSERDSEKPSLDEGE